MKLRPQQTALALLVTALPTLCYQDASWPQWDGPALDNLFRETNWSVEGKEEALWEAQLGLGYSAVAVKDGRLLTMGYDKDAGLDIIWCLDPMTGEELWSYTYPAAIMDRAHEGGTVNTPSIDGGDVYALNREGNLFRFDAESGDIIWHTKLMPEENPHELTLPAWGFSASPLIVGDELLLNCGRLLSIDKKTGKVLWASKDYGEAYGTPSVFEHGGEPVIAALNGEGVGIVSRADGAERFFHSFTGKNRGVNAATPILIDDALFVSSGKIPGGALLAFGDGEMVPVWENREMVNSFTGSVRIGEHLYGFDQSILKCIDFDGTPQWQERGIGNGALSGTPERLLVMGGTGELIIAEATPSELKVLSRKKLFEEGRFWTKPILVNGIIYCRNSRGHMIARDHRGSKG